MPHTLNTASKYQAHRRSMSHDESSPGVEEVGDDGTSVDGRHRLSRRTTLFVLGSIAFALASLVLAVEFFVVERIPLLTQSDFDGAKKRWQEHGPVSYDLDIELRGAQPGRVQVNVRNRVVIAETRDGRVPKEHTWDTWTIPGMFDTLETDMEIAEDPVQAIAAAPGTKWQLWCEFDPVLGYPRRYHRVASG